MDKHPEREVILMGRAYVLKFKKDKNDLNRFLSLYKDIFIPYSETTIKEIRRKYNVSYVDNHGVRLYHYGGRRPIMTIDDSWDWLKSGVDFIRWSFYTDDKDILVSIHMNPKDFNNIKILFEKHYLIKGTNVYAFKG